MLKDLKKKEEGDFPFGIEDLLYYVKRIEGQQFNLDLGALKQYFPFNLVMSGILKICQDLFGLRFEEIADAEVFGTVMFTFIQSMTYLLVNFWAISALICSPGREKIVTPVLWLFRMVLLSMVYERFLWHYLLLSFKKSWSYWVVEIL